MPASRNEKKGWNDVSFFTFTTAGKKMTVITNTHCLQKSSNSGSLRWCESSVWSLSLGNFSNLSTLQKKHTDVGGEGKKKSFCRSLITDYYNPMNKHLSCQLLHSEAGPRDCGAIWNLLPCYIFMSGTNFFPLRRPVKREKSCSEGILGPAGSEARTFFNAPSGLRKKPAEKDLCVSSPACHEMPRDWFERGEGSADAAASETLVPFGLALTKLLLQNFKGIFQK